jgi:hypothetical protein
MENFYTQNVYDSKMPLNNPDLLTLVMISLTVFRPTTFWKLPADNSVPSTREILYSEHLDSSYSEGTLRVNVSCLSFAKHR